MGQWCAAQQRLGVPLYDGNAAMFYLFFARTGPVPSLFTKHARKFGRIGQLSKYLEIGGNVL